MKPSRLFIVDTNVVVAGLLTRQASAPTAKILDAMIAAEIRFALSIELLAEYRAVLLRPRIRRRHGLDDGEIDTLLEALARNAVVVAPEGNSLDAPDPGDQHLWDLAAAVEECSLITGDELLRAAKVPFLVLGPDELVRDW